MTARLLRAAIQMNSSDSESALGDGSSSGALVYLI
jgi:hypothetical protein